jgi:23S rRNA (guanosine2251-2'-O)-methyltransferase
VKDELIYGMNPVLEALRSKRRAFELFVARGGTDRRLEKVLRLAQEKGVPVRQREKGDLARLCATEHHQGVALRAEPFAYVELDQLLANWRASGQAGLVLVLDEIQDPHNLGALIRSAACAGAHGVVIPRDRAARVTPAVEKASAGATETVAVAQVTNLAQALTELKDAGFWVFGADQEAPSVLFDLDLTGNVVLVVGSEGEGLRALTRKQCDFRFAIPLAGGVASLNASVAGGIALFETVRQRRGLSRVTCQK